MSNPVSTRSLSNGGPKFGQTPVAVKEKIGEERDAPLVSRHASRSRIARRTSKWSFSNTITLRDLGSPFPFKVVIGMR